MENTHSNHSTKLKQNFNSILKQQNQILELKVKAQNKLQESKVVYNDLIKKNNKKVLLFCLDSFFFQYKSFSMEMEHLEKFRLLLNNRLYCDYYKLNQLIADFVTQHKDELQLEETEIKSFPTYKELEPFQEYKQENIKDIHNNILFVLDSIHEKCQEKRIERDNYNSKHKVGFTISNLINTLTYEITILEQQVKLFIDYLAFFHILQKNQMKRVSAKFSEFYRDMETNLQCSTTFTIDDIQDNEETLEFDFGEEPEMNIHINVSEPEPIIVKKEPVIVKETPIVVEKVSESTDKIPTPIIVDVSNVVVEPSTNVE